MIVLVCGDRFWAEEFLFVVGPQLSAKRDFNYIMAALAKADQKYGITKVYHGGQRGADQCAKYWAWLSSTPSCETLPEWDKFGRAAGAIRNKRQLKRMLRWMEKKNEDGMVLAFHRNFEESVGTANMVKISRKAGLTVKILPVKH